MLAKESDDFSRVVTAFYLKLVGIWPAYNPAEERQRRKAFILTMIFLFLGGYVSVRGVYYSYGVLFEDFIFCLCNSVVVSLVLSKVVGFWLSVDPVEQRRRDITLTYTVVLILFAVYIQVADFYYTEGDFTAYLFIFVNILTVIGGLFKIFVLLPHRRDFFRLVHHLQHNFLNSDYDHHERDIVNRCSSVCTIFIGLLTLFAHLTAFCYAASPLIANIGKNESDRVLPFNLWLDLPVTMTPYYEILFIIEVLSLYQICVAYFCFDNFLCIMNLHVASQFRILQYRLTNLRYKQDELDRLVDTKICMLYSTKDVYVTFKSYVHQHQVLIAYCKKLEAIFNLIVLGDILTFSVVICLNGCQALVTESARRFIFLFFLLTSFVHLLMFTYSCDGVMRESLKVATGIYNSPWCCLTFNKYGRMLRKGAILIIMRAKVPCYITARGFFPITLETYTKVWSTAASYFTLLRQTLDTMGDT
ncbi:odorant receptor Or2-like [Lasioglossum baleicum]|uniref:odorant receptor Or2-like n=1 Tax=Lasioglossum baleicum TaxID=434251 RepID=UPI003FCDAA29